jgi:hypothetical protein
VSASGILEIIVVAALFLLSASFLIPEIRFQVRLMRSRSWPVVQGSVQRGEILHSGPARYVQLPFRSLLGYAYKVNGNSYWGLFVLPVEDMEAAEKLQRQADGQTVSVRHDPKRPNISVLVERELLGRRIIQDPMWID